jgi:trimethylamine--corrinoid protein Co-methyltransferase
MGATETMMLECACAEIGTFLGLPTQAYMALSDAKLLDAQCGLETSRGATLAALAGINSVSGPGMLDFESCFSLEKLVVDNEICGMAHRLVPGVEPRDDFPAVPRLEELMREKHLLISHHTRTHLRAEHAFPGPTIDRANRSRWEEEGRRTLGDRAHARVQGLLAEWEPYPLSDDTRAALTDRMTAEARAHDMDELPEWR